MARDEEEEERELLADLEVRTGRDLAAWMTAITAQGFADKNETIDWLRAQGIPFARASWLERIHSNGGRPIYLHQASKTTGEAKPPLAATSSAKPVPPPRVPRTLSPREMADLEKLLAAGKGYRPLYQMLEAEIRSAIPDMVIRPKPGYISLGSPREFAALTLHATELRLGLDLGDRPFDAQLQKAKLKGAGPSISHMLVLTDARQVNAELLVLIKAAHARVHGT